MQNIIKEVLECDHAKVCEIYVDENQEVSPRLKSVALEDGSFESPKYENLYPFLGENEVINSLKEAFE